MRRVLAAALLELARSGYASFRMDEVAARAEVNKTTIYRRWPSRSALVTALVAQMRAPLQQNPLPDTGQLESDLIQAFTRRFRVGRTREGRAWARLLEERHNPEVERIIGAVVNERRDEWQAMVTRAIDRGELPPATNPELVLDFVRAIADSQSSSRSLDAPRLRAAIRTVVAGARAGTLSNLAEM